ncbi:TadE/TadG family type IV pilus assembly protein [Achromobacter xylosoxidans]|uniref:TadE/TadG family type IV pilus assembly protein n=1 Tax=Alcaligenes xylosoxydans xylosoxydans TaxID=85698 RepID=UPI0023499D39|nr:TadE/TadG family type IV pilus assembly protein [Achromobacter xylosoxidans]MDC6161251.1 TadE/TadG family type IV pilus assembly protein [Achromobacter xylosoxidans]
MDRHRDPDEPRGRRRVPRGIATLEFSLTVTMLLMFVCAVVGYGVLFWMQQQLASAASEGARAAVHARFAGQADVPTVACAAAMSVFGAGSAVACSTTNAQCSWEGAEGKTATCATVTMAFKVDDWPVLSTFQALIAMLPGTDKNWIPTRLSSKAIVQISQGTP